MTSDAPKKSPPLWPFALSGIIVFIFVVVVLYLIFFPSRRVWTNDAYVTAHYATIAPRIPGQVIEVPVDDNQSVKAGTVLVKLDPQDYETSLASSKARLARDEALVSDTFATVQRQPSIIHENEAAVARVSAQLSFATKNARRYHDLSLTGAGSVKSSR